MEKQTNELSESSGFYRLVHKLIAQLVGARAEEIDTVVDDCLASIGEYFQVSQVGLGQWSKSGKILPALRTWGPKPVGDYLTTGGPGPEAFTLFCRRGSLIWNCLEDLEELPQLQDHCRQVGAMAGAFWLYRDLGSHTQHLVMAKKYSAVWPEDTIECLAAVGAVLFTALYRRRVELEAERLKQLENVISDIAIGFVCVPSDCVDAEINKAIGQIGETTGADMCIYIQCTDQDKSTLAENHEWHTDTIDTPYFCRKI